MWIGDNHSIVSGVKLLATICGVVPVNRLFKFLNVNLHGSSHET
jgi:hypothetical protein